jgi:hypothetical protein
MQLTGNYFLKLSFGGIEVPTYQRFLRRFDVIQDINKFLPSFDIALLDPQGSLTHLVPFDATMSRLDIQVADDMTLTNYNEYELEIYRRKPIGKFATGALYEITGLLDMEGMLTPDYCRASNGSMKTFLEGIAINELGCDTTNVSPSLDYPNMILQPNWNNATLFDDLKCRLVGKNGEPLFYIFISVRNGKTIFNCMSFNELAAGSTQFKFIINDDPYQDYIPVFTYKIFDNYKILGVFASKEQDYSYYDYYAGQFVNATATLDNFLSLSKYFLIDQSDTTDSNCMTGLGRTNESTKDFKNEVYASYYGRTANMVKMWITTWGINNICPGDRVQVLFGQGVASGNLATCQYSGNWLVEKLIHSYGKTHRMKVLLMRNGLDTDQDCTLIKAQKEAT